MGHHYDRLASGRERREKIEHRVRRSRVEVAGRLVGDDQRRIVRERAGDRDALLLAAGHRAGQLIRDLGIVNRVVPTGELASASLKYAKRLSLISPEALCAAKLSINRGADAAGFRDAMNVGLDVVAPLYAAKTEIGAKFQDIKAKQGLGAALKWRAAQFKE